MTLCLCFVRLSVYYFFPSINVSHAAANFIPTAYVYPPTVPSMNYNSVILVGVVFLTTVWWFVRARTHYPGPKLSGLYMGGRIVDVPVGKGEHVE